MGVFFSICSPWKVGIDAFGIPSPGSWLDRVVVVHFNLDYSYPNMKNSDMTVVKIINHEQYSSEGPGAGSDIAVYQVILQERQYCSENIICLPG